MLDQEKNINWMIRASQKRSEGKDLRLSSSLEADKMVWAKLWPQRYLAEICPDGVEKVYYLFCVPVIPTSTTRHVLSSFSPQLRLLL